MTTFAPIYSNKQTMKYFSLKAIPVKGIDKPFYVLAEKGDFTSKQIDNSLLPDVLSLTTDTIIEKVNADYKDEIAKRQEELNYLLWKRYDNPLENKDLIEELLQSKSLTNKGKRLVKQAANLPKDEKEETFAKATEDLILKAQNALSKTYHKARMAIENEVTKNRQRLIDELPERDIGEIAQAVKLYIGRFAYFRLVLLWDMVMTAVELEGAGENSFEGTIKAGKTRYNESISKSELWDGQNGSPFQGEPRGGIKPFMDFIKERDATAYDELNDYAKRALSLALKPLSMTQKEVKELFVIANKEHEEGTSSDDEGHGEKKNRILKSVTTPLKTMLEGNENKFPSIYQNNALNAFTHTSKKSLEEKRSRDVATSRKYNVEIKLENFHKLNLTVETHKVLDVLILKLTKSLPPRSEKPNLESIDKGRNIKLSVAEYMKICGIKDRTTARKQLNEGATAIYNLSLDWTEERYSTPEGRKRRVSEKKRYSVRMLDRKGDIESENPVKNGELEVQFTFDIAKYLAQSSFVMPYSTKLLKINSKKNPHSYYMMRLLLEHHNRNKDKGNSNRVSVQTLMEACPDLPKYDEVMERGRNITQKIIDPFERDLNALKEEYGLITNWQYCNSKGAPLTDKQLSLYDYNTWKDWLIEFELPADFPDQSKLIEKIKEKREKPKKDKPKQ